MQIDLINFCEIDKYASKAYCAIHNVDESKNLGDITKVDIENLPKDIDLLTHGSPCTSFSKAGLGLGGDRGSDTPSSLMWSSVEIIKHSRPKFVIWENVSNVLSKSHVHNFNEYIETLEDLGYFSYYKVMNSAKYGWPQRRDRIFVVSIRSDIDKGFSFPQESELSVILKDLLEDDVGDKFYLTDKQYNAIVTSKYAQNNRRIQTKDYCDTLCARDWRDPKCVKDEKGFRKLTPLEYWRIMGFSDEDYYKAKSCGISPSNLYKQAGNSIVLPLITKVLVNLKNTYPEVFKDGMTYLSLFSGVGAFEMGMKVI